MRPSLVTSWESQHPLPLIVLVHLPRQNSMSSLSSQWSPWRLLISSRSAPAVRTPLRRALLQKSNLPNPPVSSWKLTLRRFLPAPPTHGLRSFIDQSPVAIGLRGATDSSLHPRPPGSVLSWTRYQSALLWEELGAHIELPLLPAVGRHQLRESGHESP